MQSYKELHLESKFRYESTLYRCEKTTFNEKSGAFLNSIIVHPFLQQGLVQRQFIACTRADFVKRTPNTIEVTRLEKNGDAIIYWDRFATDLEKLADTIQRINHSAPIKKQVNI